jgi:hypothetical protein
MSAAYLFDVLHPLAFPVTARPGDVLVVRPGTPVPIAVVRCLRGVWLVMEIGPPNYGALLIPLCEGHLVPQTPADALMWAA